ncbi:MAG: hypothetical protein ACI9J3_000365 [Parvicellaceae bacterium]|jgi:hypothetical protein
MNKDPFDFEYVNVVIEATESTPFINLSKEKGTVVIHGRSITEDSVKFYWSLSRWLQEYGLAPQKKTTVVLALEYINSGSSVMISRMISTLSTMVGLDSLVHIEWYFETGDDEMKTQGAYYQEIVRCTISMHEVPDLKTLNFN